MTNLFKNLELKGSKKLRNRSVKIKLGRKPCNSTDLATLIDPLTTPRKSGAQGGGPQLGTLGSSKPIFISSPNSLVPGGSVMADGGGKWRLPTN